MHRFFVPPELLAAQEIVLPGDVAHQIRRVLRMRIGETVILLDGTGMESKARLVEINEAHVRCECVETSDGVREPAHGVHLYLALLNKPDKFEWALQKCTELGAASFTPILCERTVSGPPERARRERWERIIAEAAEQSGRSKLPALHPTLEFHPAVAQVAQSLRAAATMGTTHLALLPAPGASTGLAAALADAPGPVCVSILIGPEGGFADWEISEASRLGIKTVSLGPRTLRSETASVAALAIVLQALGDLG